MVLFIHILISFAALSQGQINPELDGTDSPGMYRFQQITLDDGLLHNTVSALFEDKDGFIWVGSAGGLQRYDGEKFKQYTYGTPDRFTMGEINQITQSADGAIWISVGKQGLFRLKYEQFTHFKHQPDDTLSLPNNSTYCLVTNADTSLWIGTAGSGLSYYKNGKFLQHKFKHTSNHVRAIHKNKDGTLWVGISWSGLFHYDNGTHKPIRALNRHPNFKNRTITKILTNADGDLIIAGERNGLLSYNPERDTAYRITEIKGHAMNLAKRPDGSIWIGSYANLYHYDRNRLTEISQNFGDPNGLSSSVIYSSMIDRWGRLWLGTYGGGINVLLDHGFKSIKYLPDNVNGLENRALEAMQFDDEGTLWVGLQNSGINTYKNGRVNQNPDLGGHKALLNGDFYTIYMDSQGTEWFCGPPGIYKHENGKFTKLSAYKYKSAQSIVEGEPGTFWIADFINGLSKYENGQFTYFKAKKGDNSLRNNNILTLNMSHDNQLWIGYFKHGIDVLRGEQHVQSFFYAPTDSTSLSNNRVTCIYTSKEGTIWVGTNHGLNKYQPESQNFRRYFAQHGLANNTIQAINEDDKGNLWIATVNGISKFDPTSDTFTNYDYEDGIDAHPFGWYCTTRDEKTGRLYFGGENGITTFHPDSLFTHSTAPTTEILSISILDKIMPSHVLAAYSDYGQELHLNYDSNVFVVEYMAPNSPSTQYAYILEGLEAHWNEVETKKASYIKVPPGRYVFKLKAKTKNSPWGAVSAIPIIIHPPFWDTWWFQASVLLVILSTVYLGVQMRLSTIKLRNRLLQKEIKQRQVIQEELESKNAELERFTYTVSHDLKSPLITIRGFLGLAREDLAENDWESIEQDLNTIDNASEKMRELLDDLLEISRIGRVIEAPEIIDTKNMAKEVLDLFSNDLRNKDISVHIQDDLPNVTGDRTRVFEVFQNLIGNAIKYMGNGGVRNIDIGIEQKQDISTFYVRDTGIGINPEFCHKVFNLFERLRPDIDGTGIGLAIVKRVVELHNGKIWAESDGEGTGTTFYFTLPTVEVADH